MKKLVSLLLAALLLLPMTASLAATEFDVTEPITITWWHAHEDQLTEYLNYMVDKFNSENDMGITVNPVYIGSYDEINTQFIAAAAACRFASLASSSWALISGCSAASLANSSSVMPAFFSSLVRLSSSSLAR